MPKPIADFTPVVVTWEDASTEAAETHETPELARDAYEPMLRKSIGFYLGEASKNGRDVVVFCTEDDRCDDRPHAVGGISYVPKGMVISVEPCCTPPSRASARKRRP